MLMSNIPRRKIYEELQIFEEGILEIERMLYSKENTKEYKKELPNYTEKIKTSYKNIKILLILFLKNEKFNTEEDFQNTLNYYINNEDEINKNLKKSKTIKKTFIENCENIEKNLEKVDLKNITETLIYLDKFNSNIPKILETKRENIK